MPSASAHRTSPAWHVPRAKILRPSTRSTRTVVPASTVTSMKVEKFWSTDSVPPPVIVFPSTVPPKRRTISPVFARTLSWPRSVTRACVSSVHTPAASQNTLVWDNNTSTWHTANVSLLNWHDNLDDLYTGAAQGFDETDSTAFVWQGKLFNGALVPLFGMDAYLHRRTQASVEGLSGRLATTARVLRDGSQRTVPAETLVPGDLVLVRSGEFFPADGLIVAGEELQVDESTLTGEAWPVRKQVVEQGLFSHIRETAVEDVYWGLAGTRQLTGHAWLRVALTGAETLYGEVVRSAVAGPHAQTPLQRSVAHLVKVLIVAAIVFCLALAWLRYHQGHGLVDALLSALTLAIAALPEEFPVVLTFFLGVGVYRLARRRALVRRSLVVESIGRVSCVCSDKTGTLTEGRLRLTHLLPMSNISEQRLQTLAAAASQADSGDPLDEAVLSNCPPPVEQHILARFPFTEDRRKATMVSEQEDGLLVAVKGAPEVVLGLCELPEAERRDWLAAVEAYSNDGHKVIGCAYRTLTSEAWTGGEPDRGLNFAGLLAFEDPVRQGVPEAIAACRAAGIRVIMVTGDHPGTAIAIARELGLGGEQPQLITGDELAAQIARGEPVANEIDIVARTLPAQKLALVRALQAGGEVVAVTGDGVNDVPALQAADIGIAMGERGTRSAREVSAIVLLDDDFGSIVGAIAEGRRLFTNLQLSFQYLLMVHIPLVITAALIPMLGYPLLYLPIHIVWLELIIHPTALLVFQNLPSAHAMGPPPTKGAQPRFFDRRSPWSCPAKILRDMMST